MNNYFIHGKIDFWRIKKLLGRLSNVSKKELTAFFAGVKRLEDEDIIYNVYLNIQKKNIVERMSDGQKRFFMKLFDNGGNLKTCASRNQANGICECSGGTRDKYRSDLVSAVLEEQIRQQLGVEQPIAVVPAVPVAQPIALQPAPVVLVDPARLPNDILPIAQDPALQMMIRQMMGEILPINGQIANDE
ncbi:unnamed protein product [Caenorhabditis sp. 36 PRJEB53466]|nr:unnamed protein product [Caenorhabditis sp. 36 PRJEB53466]